MALYNGIVVTHSLESTTEMRVPYIGKFSGGLNKVLRRYHMRPVHYSLNALMSSLCYLKDKIPTYYKSKVYKPTCPKYSSVYIGHMRSNDLRLE